MQAPAFLSLSIIAGTLVVLGTISSAFAQTSPRLNADIWKYSAAASPLSKPKDYDGPDGYFEYLQTVQPEGMHGDAFHYKTINTDALGWIISRVSGKEVTELLSDRIWSRMGAEQDGYMTVDGNGTPFAARGVHGQTIYVDPTADMVIVRLASYPTAKNAKIDPTSLPAYQAVADYLRAKP